MRERRGSGFKKILDDYEAQDKYEEKFRPEFYSDTGDFRLTLWNLNYATQGTPQDAPQVTPQVIIDFCATPRTKKSFAGNLDTETSGTLQRNISGLCWRRKKGDDTARETDQ